jgi:hypothetical protein
LIQRRNGAEVEEGNGFHGENLALNICKYLKIPPVFFEHILCTGMQ